MDKFFVGWDMPNNGDSGTKHFEYCCISVNRLLRRKSPFAVNSWLLDSGAFTRLSGLYSYKGHLSTKRYASEIHRWKNNGNLLAAVSQDYMVESLVLENTGLTVAIHQKLTIHRYDRLRSILEGSGVYLMPVLQGWLPSDYVQHLYDYGDLLTEKAWVGVGSVCKRQGKPEAIANILKAILSVRPDLRLHGFGEAPHSSRRNRREGRGVKKTALQHPPVWQMLHSADSAAAGLSRGRGKKKYVDSHNPQLALE